MGQSARVPTLWDVAARAGYIVGSVSWPVSVGSSSIRYNLPEFAGTRTPADVKMIRALAGPGWLAAIEQKAGPYLTDVNQAVARDEARTRYAVEMIRQRQTRFLTVHLAALDHAQHEEGPGSAHANETLETIDGLLGRLRDAMRALDPEAAVCVVSEPSIFRVTIMDYDRPRAGEPYCLRIDGGSDRTGILDSNGTLETGIPGNAHEAVLWVGVPPYRDRYDIKPGALDPVDGAGGIRDRLENLGFECGGESGAIGPLTRAALGFPETSRPAGDRRPRRRYTSAPRE